MIADLAPCPCGSFPWEADYGEFCPLSDPVDPGFHDFVRREEVIAVSQPPAVASPAVAAVTSSGRPERGHQQPPSFPEQSGRPLIERSN